MACTIVIGTQWGDEGKGKIIHLLAESADVVVRFASADMPGHTVFYNGVKYKLQFIPVGIFYPEKLTVLGNGMVIDLGMLCEEMDYLQKNGISLENLKISSMAHIVLPYHKILDQLEADKDSTVKRGRTRKGVASAYVDKVARKGIRVMDLMDDKIFSDKLKKILEEKNKIFDKVYSIAQKGFDVIYNDYIRYRDIIAPYVTNTPFLLNGLSSQGKKILFEGIQGTFMDLDFGTYPYVGSFNFTAGSACIGSGIGPTRIKNIIGVTKAYTTRVGEGPFPTELLGDMEEELRAAGGEYGATTGRPRRCGWLDLVMIRYSCILNGISGLAVTKLDVLDNFDIIKLCVGYEYEGVIYKDFPQDLKVLENCIPVYREFPGWKQDTLDIRNYDDLPLEARKYLDYISEQAGVPIYLVSVGHKREQSIIRRDVW
ncbi:MAG TPA: adenylosuccinate synthase [Candidatus Eremiobacteraeota bacterium]|nr:adenylosuccinate synthase [Candidatus Eremiobacteraeota bacterium]